MFKVFFLCCLAIGFLAAASVPSYAIDLKGNSLLNAAAFQFRKDPRTQYIIKVYLKAARIAEFPAIRFI